jgi:hypothetical protein
MARMQVYYAYLLTPVYKKGVSKKGYSEFRKEYFPLPWDEKEETPSNVPKEIDWMQLEKEAQELREKTISTSTYKATE